jgi:hypothetical protein
MKRSMSRQAEAERERRARIITADGEYQASKRLAAAANVMARDPAALQLRLLQTVVEVAGEKNSTLVMPIPVELLRFFDRGAVTAGEAPVDESTDEPHDLGDAEVAAAEAAISMTRVPELGEADVPPVPAVEAAPAESLPDQAVPGQESADALPAQAAVDTEAAHPDFADSEEPATARIKAPQSSPKAPAPSRNRSGTSAN